MKPAENELVAIYLTIDLVILNLAIFIASWLGFALWGDMYDELRIYLLHANLSWIVTYFLFTKRNLYLRDKFVNRIWRITQRTLVFMVVMAVLAFLIMPKQYSRTFLLEYTAIFYFGKLVFYRLFYYYITFKRKRGLNTNRALIVGYNDTTRLLQKVIEGNPALGYLFVGFASSKFGQTEKIIGTRENLEQLIKQHNIQMVFVSLSLFTENNNGKDYLRLCNKLGVRLRFVPDNQRWFKMRLNMESLGELVILNPQQIPLDNLAARTWKRIFDIGFSLLVILLIFSWLIPIIMFLIKLESKGPVFFVQKRTGINNRTFNCIKFRSMQPNRYADSKQAEENDERITRFGRFMRRTNIDELPQFFNVLWGHMSVVGPRPHMLQHTEEYRKQIDYYMVRHYVKPGITGWAQVNSLRGNTTELWKMELRVVYDMEYIENWNFWWDIQIILLTVFGKKSFKNAA